MYLYDIYIYVTNISLKLIDIFASLDEATIEWDHIDARKSKVTNTYRSCLLLMVLIRYT